MRRVINLKLDHSCSNRVLRVSIDTEILEGQRNRI